MKSLIVVPEEIGLRDISKADCVLKFYSKMLHSATKMQQEFYSEGLIILQKLDLYTRMQHIRYNRLY
jgi:hypothetical protein